MSFSCAGSDALDRSRLIAGESNSIGSKRAVTRSERVNETDSPFSRIVEYVKLSSSTAVRVRNFENDYPALLIALASSIRTGLDPLVALVQCAALFKEDSEMAMQLQILKFSIERGDTEETAIGKFASAIHHPDLPLFRTAFILSRRQGASIGECLHRLARVTRHRQSFRRKVRAALAMQKLSAVGIGGCALAIGLMQFVSNSEAISTAWHDPVGRRLLTIGISLMATGLVWMMNLAKTRI